MASNFWTKSANICKKHGGVLCLDWAVFKVTDAANLERTDKIIALDRITIAYLKYPNIRIEAYQKTVDGNEFWDMSFYDAVRISTDHFDMKEAIENKQWYKAYIKAVFGLVEDLKDYWDSVKLRDVPELPLED